MKARLLQTILNTNREIADYGEYIGISSALVHNLISIDKKTLTIKYGLDTFREGRASIKNEELLAIWDKLHELVANGQMKDIVEGNDAIENPITIYTVKDGKLIQTYTDKYEFPNVTISGERMYKDKHFLEEEDALTEGIEDNEYDIDWRKKRIAELNSEIDKLKEKVNVCQNNIKSLKKLYKEKI